MNRNFDVDELIHEIEPYLAAVAACVKQWELAEAKT